MAQQYIGLGRIDGTTQSVAFTGTAAPITNAWGAQCRKIRVVANTACHIKVTAAGTAATTSDPFIPANSPEYFLVPVSQKASFIRAGTDGLVTATSGTAWVSEIE